MHALCADADDARFAVRTGVGDVDVPVAREVVVSGLRPDRDVVRAVHVPAEARAVGTGSSDVQSGCGSPRRSRRSTGNGCRRPLVQPLETLTARAWRPRLRYRQALPGRPPSGRDGPALVPAASPRPACAPASGPAMGSSVRHAQPPSRPSPRRPIAAGGPADPSLIVSRASASRRALPGN